MLSFRHVYLVKLLDHLFNADISILGDFALHVGEPLTELLVLFVEHSPFIQLLGYLLPAQRQLYATATYVLAKLHYVSVSQKNEFI